jgi:dolichol-phosphate mannosyltransferase
VPLANEESTVDQFYDRVSRHLLPQDLLIAVIDNVSKDNTRERLEKLSENDPRLVVVWAPENRCVVDAYFRGYREALSQGCEWILEMDGGFSHRPEEIPRFLDAMSQGVDFVAGCRFLPGATHRGSISRRFLSRGGTILAKILLGSKMNDMTSGFECFSRAAMYDVLQQGVKSRGHFFQTEIRHFLQDWNWSQVPITYENPSKSVGHHSILEALRNLFQLAFQRRQGETKPSGSTI